MKRIITLALSAAIALSFTACTSSSSSEATSSEPKDYAQIISEARSAEENEAFMIVSPTEDGTGYEAIEGYSADYTPDVLAEEVTLFTAPVIGITPEDTTDFAFTLSAMMTQSYGIAIVMPAEGKTEDVKAGLQLFIENQKNSMNNYLMDQYEIASAATVTVAPTGEVILVCAPDSASILENIEAALAS